MDIKEGNASKGFPSNSYKPNAHFTRLKVCKNNLKHKEGVACTGACLDNTMLVFVRRRSLDDHPLF